MTDAMRFGMFIPQGWRLDLVDIDPADHWETMLGVARHAENGPWESIWVYDHFHTTPTPTDEATHEAWTLMAALAASTERIRLGQMCTCVGYRNPAYVAKIAATTDIVSGGRVEMGIGAGWYEHEWRAYGYGFPRAGERLAMLDEGVQVMRQLWSTGRASLDGEHYEVDGAICRPLPLQDGGIPLWIAGGGEQKTLRIAAKYAQYTNFAGILEHFRHKSEVLARHCKDVGTDFDLITRSANYNVLIGETEADVQDQLAWVADRYRRFLPEGKVQANLKPYRDSPAMGTPEQIAEAFTELRDAGMTYAICYFPQAAYDRSSIKLFEGQVIPALT
ncbi:MAG TPA: LLM class F420-dependent oxidoreductase [Jiangellaceae bacterium]|nr:LLM class F420-dependent oxidoreductase [Jiangellaceae bacterium]